MNKSKNNKLFAGPFLGEFGWELFCWQGYIRHLSRSFDYTTISCRKGLSGLYEDFADEIIEYDPPEYRPSCEKNAGNSGNYPKPDSSYSKYIGPNPSFGITPRYIPINGTYDPNFPQEYYKYGNPKSQKEAFDILIHARSRSSSGTYSTDFRNLPKDSWDIIVDYLKSKNYSVASIGSTKDSLHIDKTFDLRGIKISDLCDYCSMTQCVLSPSSGPLHLAALCGTEIIVWSGERFNQFRYEKSWNPFKNKVQYLKGWANVNLDHIKNAIDNINE
ncbi:MAG: hypothetical protein EBY39_10475 [Flavobacteriia bacterium]|nr:hypothetical protein [Flavobacteriia bacterium]